ncbi:hypothetical protein ART_0311 [Arthrobacter sp. PAMC 25486]|nr:hypothetical protein ART_0311 [Arthrobacter sp. PAMC 25486]
MVAEIDPVKHVSDHSSPTVGEQWHPTGTGEPIARRELVDVVPAFSTEQLREPTLARTHHMHAHGLGAGRQLIGVVVFGD